MLSLSKWVTQEESHSSGRESLILPRSYPCRNLPQGAKIGKFHRAAPPLRDQGSRRARPDLRPVQSRSVPHRRIGETGPPRG